MLNDNEPGCTWYCPGRAYCGKHLGTSVLRIVQLILPTAAEITAIHKCIKYILLVVI